MAIRVNMTPCDDVQTIHASQNDGEARQWGFELHNNGEKIDSSSISDQMVFKAYEGGTEQILPENGSTPTTSPFLGDIKYPQGLLTDQEFLYRESPTEEDGLAKITDIKGNTLVWKQLVPSLSAMSGQNGTISVANNVATITSSSSASYLGVATSGGAIELPKGGHKYLLTVEVNSSKAMSSCNLWYGNSINYIQRNILANTWTKVSAITSYGTPSGQYVQLRGYASFEQGDTLQVRNWNHFDLTSMGLDSITSVDEFTSLFSLPYYSYNQGSLLSFNGNGIKTVGKNLLNLDIADGTYLGLAITKTDGKLSVNGRTLGSGRITFVNTPFYLPFDCVFSSNISAGFFEYQFRRGGQNIVTLPIGESVAVPQGWYDTFGLYVAVNTDYDYVFEFQVEEGATVTSFEPYTSSTSSLPISTYFPSGMKSAGDVYDELTETKAITRIGAVDLGTLNWVYDSNTPRFYTTDLQSVIAKPTTSDIKGNIESIFELLTLNQFFAQTKNLSIAETVGGNITIIDTAYTTTEAFKSAMSGVYLYYELATPTETSFTTASLVTENAEIPLSNEDGVLIGKCTEQLSSESGFFDAKIKLADADGECYSNKIQLHVERSPQ